MGARFALFALLIPQFLSACTCVVSRSACAEVATSNLVFIGTVEAIQPSILDQWKPNAHRGWLQDPALAALHKDNSAAGLAKLKTRYLELLFDLPDSEKLRIQAASTQARLSQVINLIVHEGTRVSFKVDVTFQRKKDSDDDDQKPSVAKTANDDDHEVVKQEKSFQVWNDAGDCGIPFQEGESYLVYANDDEDTGRLETNVCHRTARVSDSGEDLAYLHYFQTGNGRSSRLEGFLTSQFEHLQRDELHYSEKIAAPVSNLVVELKLGKMARYTEPDAGGRFVFDGLAEGDYQISAFERGFPTTKELLSGPRRIHIKADTCPTAVLLVMQDRSGR